MFRDASSMRLHFRATFECMIEERASSTLLAMDDGQSPGRLQPTKLVIELLATVNAVFQCTGLSRMVV